jgi:MoxR-like ATPase
MDLSGVPSCFEGQERAVEGAATAVLAWRSQMERTPLVLVFGGMAGAGKRRLARVLASALHTELLQFSGSDHVSESVVVGEWLPKMRQRPGAVVSLGTHSGFYLTPPLLNNQTSLLYRGR